MKEKRFELWFRANGRGWRRSTYAFGAGADGSPDLADMAWAVLLCQDNEVRVFRKEAVFSYKDPDQTDEQVVVISQEELGQALMIRQEELDRRRARQKGFQLEF